MKKNKIMLALFIVVAMISLVACSSANSPNEQTLPESNSETGSETTPQDQEAVVNFPTEPIKLIVPFDPGGAQDITARFVAEHAEKHLGQPIVIENRGGGGGVTGQSLGAKQKPDGYTLTSVSPSVIINPLTKTVDYDADSFEYIVSMVVDTDIIFTKNEAPFNDLESLIKYAQENPGKVKMGNTGTMNSDHLSALTFEKATDAIVTHIPFEGGAKLKAALLGGHIDVVVANSSEFFEEFKSGQVAAIGVMAADRLPDYQDIPTLKEKGYDIVGGPFRAIAAPKGTPPEIITILEEAFMKALSSEELQEDFIKAGIPANTHAGYEQFNEQVEFYKENYAEIVKQVQGQ